jgi:nucleotide-binding universal stress UspA family protein
VLADSGSEATRLASEPVVIAAVFGAWVLTGLAVAAVAIRLGHERRVWLALGTALGPVSLALLLLHRSPRLRPAPVVIDPGIPRSGDVSVLVGLLGSAGDAAEAGPLLRAQGDQLGAVTLCRAVEVEAVTDPDWADRKQEATQVLRDGALFLGGVRPSLVLLPGPPADVIARYAIRHSFDHVVVLGDHRVQRSVISHPNLRRRLMIVSSRGEDPR